MRSTLRHVLLTLSVLVPVLLSGGCRGSGGTSGKRSSKDQKLVPDKRFGTTSSVRVWEVGVHHSLVFTSREISGEETPEARRLRTVWVQRSRLQSRLLLHPRRLVWILPTRATPGGSADELHLILKPNSNVAALVSHKRKVYWADSPAQVAAWMEGALKPSAPLSRLEVLAQRTEGARSAPTGTGIQHSKHILNGLLVPRTSPGAQAGARYNLRSRAVDATAFGGPRQGQSLLWDFALLPLVVTTSGSSLATLRGQQRWPLRVDLRLARTEPPGAPWLRLNLRLAERKRRHVASRLLRLPPGPGYRRMFGPLTFAKGRQLQQRTVKTPRKRHKGDPRNPTLVVRNNTRRTAYLYADGVLLGWTGPRQTHTLRTGEPGYYRITARSLFGTTLWGPKDLYVPGEVSLGKK